MQIKTTVRYHLGPQNDFCQKDKRYQMLGVGCGERECSCIASETVNEYSPYGEHCGDGSRN